MDSIVLQSNREKYSANIELPLSKSISNRLLMIYAAMGWDYEKLFISKADDTQLLKKLLGVIIRNEASQTDECTTLDCKNAGTVFRFLCPLLASSQNEYILTGAERMMLRPIAPLVHVLLDAGAAIEYLNEEEYPPLKFNSADLNWKSFSVDGSLSSQFVTALLMQIPKFTNQCTIELEGEISSWPYIQMTLDLMSHFGINSVVEDNTIEISGQYAKPDTDFKVESDWSSAAFWYELLAIAGEGELFLEGLQMDSIQGDAVLMEIFSSLGVQTTTQKDSVLLKAEGEIIYNQNIDFINFPDLAPAVIATCAALNIMGKFTGLESLNLKESRRMDLLCSELEKLGYDLRDVGEGEFILINSCNPDYKEMDFSNISIQTDNDHRMVMAFAPFAVIGKGIQIEQPNAVVKSYPFFWEEIRKLLTII